jgi:hypothetical protein
MAWRWGGNRRLQTDPTKVIAVEHDFRRASNRRRFVDASADIGRAENDLFILDARTFSIRLSGAELTDELI